MIKLLYKFLDHIPLYRVVLYALMGISLTALILSGVGQLNFAFTDMVITLVIIVGISYGLNLLLALLFRAKPNAESSIITGFIIFLLIFPQSNLQGWLLVAVTAAIAQASKYVLAFRGRHIFNPAAVAVMISSLVGISGAVWWVGTPVLLPAVVILGGLVVAKVREFTEVGIYFISIVAVVTVINLFTHHDIVAALSSLFIAGPIVFAGTIMLTEPLTAPAIKSKKIWIALLIGLLTGSSLPWVTKPEVALLIGNLIAFLLGQRRQIKLKLLSKQQIAPGIVEIMLQPLHPLRFKAGQYIELTIPHRHVDQRGVRRVFSIASTPHSDQLRITMNVPEGSSSFKKALINLQSGTIIHATRTGGDFTLPARPIPLVFIAGGIGITPFLAMVEELLRRDEKRPITIFYGVQDAQSLVYKDILLRAQNELGATIVPVIDRPHDSWHGEKGKISADLIKRYVAVDRPHRYYVSGPNAMVEAIKRSLREASVKRSAIRTDYFTGY